MRPIAPARLLLDGIEGNPPIIYDGARWAFHGFVELVGMFHRAHCEHSSGPPLRPYNDASVIRTWATVELKSYQSVIISGTSARSLVISVGTCDCGINHWVMQKSVRRRLAHIPIRLAEVADVVRSIKLTFPGMQLHFHVPIVMPHNPHGGIRVHTRWRAPDSKTGEMRWFVAETNIPDFCGRENILVMLHESARYAVTHERRKLQGRRQVLL